MTRKLAKKFQTRQNERPANLLRLGWKEEGLSGPLYYVVPAETQNWMGKFETTLPFSQFKEPADDNWFTGWYKLADAKKIAKQLGVALEIH